MTNIEYAAEYLNLGFVLMAFFAAYHYVYAPSTFAWWRQRLFEERNHLWDVMRDEGALDHPSHRALRDRYNAVIRLGGSLNVVRLVVVSALVKNYYPLESSEPKPEYMWPNERAKEAYEHAEYRLNREIIQRVCYDTMPGMLIFIPLKCVYLPLRLLSRIKGLVSKHLSPKLDSWAKGTATQIRRFDVEKQRFLRGKLTVHPQY